MKKSLLAIFLFIFALGCEKPITASGKSVDAVFVGAGIMSATLATLLLELDPTLSIEIFERLPTVAEESSGAWNNAGTGHAALCELNYTHETKDGNVDISKAIKINESFELSKQLWAYEVQEKKITNPQSFINRIPHISFVWGEDNIRSLKKRYQTMVQNPLFTNMEYSEDSSVLHQWIPVVMEGRDKSQKVAATRVQSGSDVNFGVLTQSLLNSLGSSHAVHVNHEVRNLERNDDGTWTILVRDITKKESRSYKTKFIFLGAGGGTLPLLQKSGIPEAKGFGGVPVGGQWLVSTNADLIARHAAKVYGKAPIGSPPMSVPHLDTRFINGKKALLFGPFATFSTKFLKNGSWLDMPLSFSFSNIIPMVQSGWDNIPLTRYLINQLLLSKEERLESLKQYLPNAKLEDWYLETAGQRVQVIKNDPEKGGILQFGTELVLSKDGSVAALLGASPGASVAVDAMLKVIEHSYKERLKTPEWQAKLKRMIPSYGIKLSENLELLHKIRKHNDTVLGLN